MNKSFLKKKKIILYYVKQFKNQKESKIMTQVKLDEETMNQADKDMCFDLDIYLKKNEDRFDVSGLSVKLQQEIAAKKVRSKAKKLIQDIEKYINKFESYPKAEATDNCIKKLEAKKTNKIVVSHNESDDESACDDEGEETKEDLEKIKKEVRKTIAKKPTKPKTIKK